MGCCGNHVGTEQDEKKQFDPKFKGPMEDSERHCRDCWMIPIFIAFWVGLIIVAIQGTKLGDSYRLFYGYDSFGNTCGRPNSNTYDNINSGIDLEKQNKLLWFAAGKTKGINLCVATCPAEDSCSLGTVGSQGCDDVEVDSGFCVNDDKSNPYKSDADQNDAKYGSDENGCPKMVWNSQVLMNRCLPLGDVVGGSTDAVMEAINIDGVATDFVNDLQKAKVAIIVLLAATMVLTLIFVFVMRWIAAALIRVAFYGLLLGTPALIGFLWYMYMGAKEDYDKTQATNSTGGTASTKKNMDMFLALAITWSVLGGILFIILLFLRKRIELVVQLFKEAGRALTKMPLLLFYPLLTFTSVIVVLCYFGYYGLLLLSAGEQVIDESSQHVTYEISETLQYMTLYHIFGFYWTFELCVAFQEAVIAGSIATWYFTREKSDMSWPIAKTFWRTFKYHLGSLLLGALIIAIVKIIQFIVWYFEKQIKKASNGNMTVEWLIKIVKCCLWCCEKCLKFLNRNAYIEIAIYGKSFCRSAWSAFAILLRNALRVAAINTVGDFVLFLFKFIITLMALVGAFFYFQYQDKIEENIGDTVSAGLQWESLIILLIGLFAWLIAGMFLGVYEMAIDTIFIAFCEDAERNDGSPAKPYFMSKGLLKFMSKEERRTQKRTLNDAQHYQKKAAAAQAVHADASGLKIDPEEGGSSEA